MNRKLTRRDALKLGLAGTGALAVPIGLQRAGVLGGGSHHTAAQEVIGGTFVGDYRGTTPAMTPFTRDFVVPKVLSGAGAYTMTMKQGTAEYIPGKQTPIWAYYGTATDGTEVANPVIMERYNNAVTCNVVNQLPEPMSVHLHGSPSLPQYDGHPELLVQPGQTYAYQWPNSAEARTLWYHDHAMHLTARHVYQGLAGMYIQTDDWEQNAQIPHGYGQYDIPLIVGDKMFTRDGALVYDDDGQDDLLGDVTLVNGVPWPRMTVQRRRYRFRYLMASLSRGYRLALSNGMPFTVIATDAGLVEKPVSVKNITIGMAERYEFIIDFSKVPAGTKVVLQNTRADGKMRNVMRFDVTGLELPADASNPPIPAALRVGTSMGLTMQQLRDAPVVATRRFEFERNGGEWTINDRTWQTGRIDAAPKLGDVEIWELVNGSGGWFHPVHVHLVDGIILSRNGRPAQPYERGWKDVFYVGENQTLRVKFKFGPHKGRYVMHCHNTVHEDHDMMNQWEVV